MKQFAEEIVNLKYIVQRNWINLPDSVVVEGHHDLDLYCDTRDVPKLEQAIDAVKKRTGIDVDYRYPGDNYYPEIIERLLLENPRTYNGFKIPNKGIYFTSLYYHNTIHKNNNPYEEELKKAFLDWSGTVRCVDEGVGYYGIS